MNEDLKTRLLTNHTLKYVKIDILPVFFPVSAIKTIKTGGIRCSHLT